MKVLKGNEKKEYDEFIINHVKVKITTKKRIKPPKDFEPYWKKASVIL